MISVNICSEDLLSPAIFGSKCDEKLEYFFCSNFRDMVKVMTVVFGETKTGDRRFEYEYEIEYEHDFSNRKRILLFIKPSPQLISKRKKRRLWERDLF